MSEQHILFTGLNGMLGSDLARTLDAQGINYTGLTHEGCDVTDRLAVDRVFRNQQPRIVIHCAAMTNVDQCELEPDAAYRTNTIGTLNVAQAADKVHAKLVVISTCGLFDGQKAAPYNEFDAPRPLTHYAQSKVYAELLAREYCRKTFILRVGWLFGGSAQHQKNYVAARWREALGKDRLQSANDKFGSPTYTVDVAEKILQLVDTEAYGLYHIANEGGTVSRFQYVQAIMDALGLPVEIEPVDSSAFQRPANVPTSEMLECWMLAQRGFSPMRDWRVALTDYVTSRFMPEIERQFNSITL